MIPKTAKITRDYDKDGWRWYTVDGQKMISVTKVLGVAVHENLIKWFQNNSKNKTQKISKESADKGTVLHDLVEKDLLNQPFKVPREYKQAFANWTMVKNQHQLNAIEAESFVYSKKYGYAGQMDSFLKFTLPYSQYAIGDLKTGKRYYMAECSSQCAAYRQAVTEMTDIKASDMGLVGIHVPANLEEGDSPAVYVKSPIEADKYFKQFLCVLETFKWKYRQDILEKQIAWEYLNQDALDVYYKEDK